MRIDDILAGDGPCFSVEFFPPKTPEGVEQLFTAVAALKPLEPDFVSVTYGAGGATRDGTVEIADRIHREHGLETMAHLSCVGETREGLAAILDRFASIGIENILALRGDPPTGLGTAWTPHADGLVHADELVAMVTGLGDFCVGVAAFPQGHPESPDLENDALRLAGKADAGAQFAVTQFFFDPDHYFRLLDRAHLHGCHIPVIPGIMPVTNYSQIRRFAELAGTPVPTALAQRLQRVEHEPEPLRDHERESEPDPAVADLDLTGDTPKATNIHNVVESKDPIETYHVIWSPDGKFVTFSRGPKLNCLFRF
jgi:methylenetetrahydrofolate reductase (NADPH)